MKNQIVFIGRWETSINLSGPQKVARELYTSIAKNNKELLFITYFFKDLNKSTILKRLLGSEVVSDELKIYRLGILRLLVFLILNPPQVIHVITFERFLIPMFYFRNLLFRRSKIVYTAHGLYFIEKSYLKKLSYKDELLEKILFAKSDILVFLSTNQKRKVEQKFNISNKEISIIPNGIEKDFINSRIHDVQNEKLSIFYYAKSEIKQVTEFVRHFNDFTMDGMELYIIGDGINMQIKEQKKFNCPGRIPNEEIGAFLNKMDIYINLSVFESFSLLALESMAKGVIPIVTSRAGISEYLEDGVDGFIITPGNEKRIHRIIISIKNNELDALEIKKRAISKAATFVYPNIINQYKQIYY